MLTSFLYAAIIGIVAGWLAGKISQNQVFGLFDDLVIGIVGSVIGNFVLGLIGLQAYGLIGSIIASTARAMLLLWGVRLVSGRKTVE